jgi:hypothetical protein
MNIIPAPIRDVLVRMESLQARLDASGDWRAVFCHTYRLTTQRVGEAIGRGEFRDAEWMTRLDVRFAQYYFDALAQWDQYMSGVEPWTIAFAECNAQRTTALQDIALGMNAHINHDLVLAIVDVLAPDDDLDLRRADHDHINTVLARIVDEVQDGVEWRYDPLASVWDLALGNIDEAIMGWVIEVARNHVWEHVLLLRSAPDATAHKRFLATQVGNYARIVTLPTRKVTPITHMNRFVRKAWRRLSP